ncbi:MAG: hypothetical protein R6X27_10435, partial [Candidatus Desulfacyla sp.]
TAIRGSNGEFYRMLTTTRKAVKRIGNKHSGAIPEIPFIQAVKKMIEGNAERGTRNAELGKFKITDEKDFHREVPVNSENPINPINPINPTNQLL